MFVCECGGGGGSGGVWGVRVCKHQKFILTIGGSEMTAVGGARRGQMLQPADPSSPSSVRSATGMGSTAHAPSLSGHIPSISRERARAAMDMVSSHEQVWIGRIVRTCVFLFRMVMVVFIIRVTACARFKWVGMSVCAVGVHVVDF